MALNRSFYSSTSSTPINSVRSDSSSGRDTSSVVTKLRHRQLPGTLYQVDISSRMPCHHIHTPATPIHYREKGKTKKHGTSVCSSKKRQCLRKEMYAARSGTNTKRQYSTAATGTTRPALLTELCSTAVLLYCKDCRDVKIKKKGQRSSIQHSSGIGSSNCAFRRSRAVASSCRAEQGGIKTVCEKRCTPRAAEQIQNSFFTASQLRRHRQG